LKQKHLYKFGEFTVNAEDHTVSRNGETVPVTPKMFDLLLVFLQNPGRVLGKDFLLKAVWPNSFVEEGNITFNIGQLRKALDDNVQSPVYIETIPRRGYRFLPSVEASTEAGSDEEEPTPDAIEPVAAVPGSRPKVLIAITAVLLLAGAFAVAGWLLRKNESNGSLPILNTPFSLAKLSTDGSVYHIAISPDGKNVVYTHRTSGKQSIWLRQLETATNVLIVPPSADFYGGLIIAPDGNSIYFVRGTQQEPVLSVYRMPIFGGVPQKVTDGTQGWISVSKDGTKISYVRCPYTDGDWCSLYIADSLDGRNEKKLVTRPRPFRIGDNKFSPDGRSVAFATGQSRTSSNEFTFSAVDIETGAVRDLTPEKFFNIGYIEWLPDQSGWLITAVQLPGTGCIWHILPNGEARKLTSDAENYSRLSLDASGSSLVSTQVEPDFKLMLFETENPTAPPRILGNANTVAIAPDGKLYFSSGRTGNFEIWSVNADSTDSKQLTNNPSAESIPFPSPDAQTIFFTSDRTGVIQIWRMHADGTDQRQVTTEEGGLPLRISPDGAWLYYRSSLKSTLRRVSLENGREEVVLKETGRGVVLSPDLTRIAYSQRQGTETLLTVASFPEGEPLKMWKITAAPNLAHLAWPQNDRLAYVLTDDAREIGSLWLQPLNSDTPRMIADLSGEGIAELAAFSMSTDGTNFAIIKGSWKHDAVLLRGLK
jgi:Tol biopolymer transport system component/DNA-binding winged helix-turn-helix (wHTH) protein